MRFLFKFVVGKPQKTDFLAPRPIGKRSKHQSKYSVTVPTRDEEIVCYGR